MEKEKLLQYAAPCSLLCYTCMGFREGVFAECGPKLHACSEGICEFLADVSGLSGEERKKHFAFFREFRDSLSHLSGGSCHGCRSDDSLKSGCIGGCVIPACVKEHGVDFCGQCPDFPCEKGRSFFDGVDSRIRQTWETGSARIREIGPEAYVEEKKNVSHYAHYARSAKD